MSAPPQPSLYTPGQASLYTRTRTPPSPHPAPNNVGLVLLLLVLAAVVVAVVLVAPEIAGEIRDMAYCMRHQQESAC
jgi:hypothetical protein